MSRPRRAARTGATIYASEETCGVMTADLARMKADAAIQAECCRGSRTR
ncbi:hypothetical protein [Streptosporangium sp. KLBMP 9127]|nr:hypothetical protein [Streptosporangium sp. KLBMP 9127]